MTPLERVARAAAASYGIDDAAYDALPDVNPIANGEWDKRDWLNIARGAISAISEALDESSLVESARLMAEMEGSEDATKASLLYDEVIDWLDASIGDVD